MSIIEIITARRTVYQFKNQLVEADKLTQCLKAAIWAPNHRLTQPWRFWVLSREKQTELASLYAEKRATKRAELGTEEYDNLYEKAVIKFLKIPQVVFVGQVINDNPILKKEDYAACSCAIQNFQLAAWELGLGVQWSTGPVIGDQRTFDLLGADSSCTELIGVLYMGYPDCIGESKRKSLETVVTYV